MGKIIVSHIGARNGYYPFPFNKNFKDEVTAYLYEADKNCIDEIKRINKNRYETMVINKFIGSKNGQIDFHINSCPHNSSSLETNFENNFCLYHGFDDDMTLEGAFQNIKKIKLNTFTLSSLLSSNEVPPIDSLSLDTQGNEIDILNGLEGGINNILSIATEINFVNLYKNQTTPSELFKFMEKNGFYLIDLFDYKRGSASRIPKNFRGNGQLIHSDIVFFKDPKFILNLEAFSKVEKIEKLIKLIFISILHNNLDYAYYCFSLRMDEVEEHLTNLDLKNNYQIFISKMVKLMKSDLTYPNQYLKNDYYKFQKIYAKKNKSKSLKFKSLIYKILGFALSKLSFTINLINYLFNREENKALMSLLREYSFYELCKDLKNKEKKALKKRKHTYSIFGREINA